MALKSKLLERFALGLGPGLYLLLSRLLFGSGRSTHIGREQVVELLAGRHLAAFWHYSVAYGLYASRNKRYAAMVSGSKDGEYVARILARQGVIPVRGSRTKGGLAALKKIQAAVDDGCSAAIVADGSQGPPLQVQAGVILLASRTGVPILPAAWGVDRYWVFRSWDRTVLPKPFARHVVCYGSPLLVPAGLKAGDLESYRLVLEQRLLDLYRQAWGHFGRTGH